jgi:hypothetical protein
MKEFKVTFVWDDDRWYTKSEELGLTLEHGSFDALVERVRMAVPEMAELNFGHTGDINLLFDIERKDNLTVAYSG